MLGLYKEMESSRGIIIGAPIYFWAICGQGKVMIDRTLALRYPFLRLANKVGASILVATRRGCTNASTVLTQWMLSNHMVVADVVDGYAMAKGAIRRDAHAMKASLELGRLVVKLAEKKFTYPDEFNNPIYRFVEKKYGVDICPISPISEEKRRSQKGR